MKLKRIPGGANAADGSESCDLARFIRVNNYFEWEKKCLPA